MCPILEGTEFLFLFSRNKRHETRKCKKVFIQNLHDLNIFNQKHFCNPHASVGYSSTLTVVWFYYYFGYLDHDEKAFIWIIINKYIDWENEKPIRVPAHQDFPIGEIGYPQATFLR